MALRGDGAWVGVLEPGRLRIYRTDLNRDEVKPHEVATATRGELALPKFLNDVTAGKDDVARRRYLTKLLDGSAREATKRGLSPTDALSLVGRGLFWRFLCDRNLLAGLKPTDVCQGAQSWEACLDNKARALRTFHWLDETFNGGLLPFEHQKPRELAPDVFSSVLGNIAHGATETGQLRLPTDWHEVNFSYVPVGLLSEVYEDFAHHLDPEDASRNSIHYTPSHLVDFIVTQALEELPPRGRPRILDPAAGAGIFLVTALRKLVERDWKETGERPDRRRIREILNRQLVGFDRDAKALRLAELALYLTALELDPKPRPLSKLTFDALRGAVLIDVSQQKHGSLAPVDERFRAQFDLVIGNPPWRAVGNGLEAKRDWIAATQNLLVDRLGAERAGHFDLPDTNMDIPFVWRAMEWAKPKGRIVLLTHARWLFGVSDSATRARNDLLEATRVTGILNGTALRDTNVWPAVRAPWCALFATNEVPEPFDQAAFQFVSPAIDANPESAHARMRIDWLDAQTVPASEVIARPWALKARFRGNALARLALDTMVSKGEPLGSYLARIGTSLKNGYQVGGKARTQQDSQHMKGWPDLKEAGPLPFAIRTRQLPRFDRKTLLYPRARTIYDAPLLLLRKAMPADLIEARTHVAKERIAFHESFHGASFNNVENGEEVASYLQLVLQSSAFPFFVILTDAQYGVFLDAIHLEGALHMPVVGLDRLSTSQRRSARELAGRLANGLDADLLRKIDSFVLGTFDLNRIECDAVFDTLETALPIAESKKRSVETPTAAERRRFIETLRASLGNVLAAVGTEASVEERDDFRWSPWRMLQVTMSPNGRASRVEPPLRAFLEEADANGTSLVSVRASETVWFIGLLERYAQWTPTRARLLANELIAERSNP